MQDVIYALRSRDAMKKYLKDHMEVGRWYTFLTPVFGFGDKGERKGYYKKQDFKLLKIYGNYCLFETEAKLKQAIPLYEVLHLLRGEKYTNGLYSGMPESEERRQEIRLL